MRLLLSKKREEVLAAQLHVQALKESEALAQYRAKKNTIKLISSTKGLLTIFAAGGVKGLISSERPSAKGAAALFGKKFLSGWLGDL